MALMTVYNPSPIQVFTFRSTLSLSFCGDECHTGATLDAHSGLPCHWLHAFLSLGHPCDPAPSLAQISNHQQSSVRFSSHYFLTSPRQKLLFSLHFHLHPDCNCWFVLCLNFREVKPMSLRTFVYHHFQIQNTDSYVCNKYLLCSRAEYDGQQL